MLDNSPLEINSLTELNNDKKKKIFIDKETIKCDNLIRGSKSSINWTDLQALSMVTSYETFSFVFECVLVRVE